MNDLGDESSGREEFYLNEEFWKKENGERFGRGVVIIDIEDDHGVEAVIMDFARYGSTKINMAI